MYSCTHHVLYFTFTIAGLVHFPRLGPLLGKAVRPAHNNQLQSRQPSNHITSPLWSGWYATTAFAIAPLLLTQTQWWLRSYSHGPPEHNGNWEISATTK